MIFEVKTNGESAQHFDRTSVVIKLKVKIKILHKFKYKTKK